MKFTLNLASRRYINKRALSNGFVAALCLLLLVGAWLVNALVVNSGTLTQERQRLAEVNQQLQALRGGPQKTLSPAERAELEQKFLVVAELLKQDAFRWTELLDRMENLLPEGVTLSGFRPNYKKKSLALSGRARSLKEMRLFLDRLLKDKSFAQVYINNHSRIKVKDYADNEREAISFTFQLEGVF